MARESKTVVLKPQGVTFDDVINVARFNAKVEISDEAKSAIDKSRKYIDEYTQGGKAIYGVSTGFGALADKFIDPKDRVELQKSLIRSHAAGVGAPIEAEVVRALIFLRLRTFVSGRTGVRYELAKTYADFLNANITPVVPEFGSLGCSGDLAPLSHCALAMMGEGQVIDSDGKIVDSLVAMKKAGINPIELKEKEGLALINGTDGMLGMLIMALADLRNLTLSADITTALSIEGLLGTNRVFAPDLHAGLRNQVGQATSAANLYALLEGSEIVASHFEGDTRVQDAYSLRCAPQVNGAVRDIIDYATTIAARELSSAIDNPVVMPDGRVESNGNFHGAPIAYVLDFLAIAATDLGSMSERRTDRMLDPARSVGLPAFLAFNAGVDSGLMIAQYTQAALVSENKRLSVPASVDSIPSSAMQEDHVSMGWSAARKLRKVIDNLTHILGIELLTAARAVELRKGLKPAKPTQAVISELRKVVDPIGPDRFLSPELAKASLVIKEGRAVKAASAIIPTLI